MEKEEDSKIKNFCRIPNSDTISLEELVGHSIVDVRFVETDNEDQWFCITCVNGDKLLLTPNGDDYGSWIDFYKYECKTK